MSKFDPFMQAMVKLTEAQQLLSQGPASYYVEQFIGAYEYLMANFAPFKVGDKVVLVKAPNPMPSGWAHCEHFIKVGATAEVRNVECSAKGFSVEVHFDDESWINNAKAVIPVDDKHVFTFSDKAFLKLPPS